MGLPLTTQHSLACFLCLGNGTSHDISSFFVELSLDSSIFHMGDESNITLERPKFWTGATGTGVIPCWEGLLLQLNYLELQAFPL